MKRFIALAFAFAICNSVFAQDHDSHGHDHDAGHGQHDKDKDAGQDQDADMAAWMQMNQPGPEHKMLKSLVGNWTYTMNYAMPGMDEPMKMAGKVSRKMIMQGRYFVEEWHGDGMMGADTFHGLGYTAYDNMKKKFVQTWMDNMSTSIVISEGHADDSLKTITLYGEMPNDKGGVDKTKWVWKIINNEKNVMEMWQYEGDKANKTADLILVRAK